MSLNKLPLKLENCPIADVVTELRFKTSIPREAVLGVFYERVKQDFPEIEALPILQVPPAILAHDPNLLFKPHHRLRGKRFTIQIGPDVISVSPLMPYPGWSEYFPVIKNVFTALFDSKIPNTIIRIGLRYTNFFPDQNVFGRVDLDLKHDGKSIPFKNTVLRMDVDGKDGFTNILQIASNAQRAVQIVGKNGMNQTTIQDGSVLDIDIYKDNPAESENLEKLLDNLALAHKHEKHFFWDMLKEEARKELKPIY